MSSDPPPRGRGPGLGTRILLGMVVGSVLGVLWPRGALGLEPLGDLFIRLLILVAVPLIFFNLLAGLTALADVRTFGRLAGKTVSYFVSTDVLALILGLGMTALLQPGAGMRLSEPLEGPVGTVPSLTDVLLDMVPTNVVAAFAEGNVVQIVVVAVFLGLATLLVGGEAQSRLSTLFADLATLLRRLVDLVLWTAPVGIGALMAVTVARYGSELLGPLVRFLGAVYAGQLVVFVCYLLLLRFFTAWRPLELLKKTGPVWATTAATTSSLASLSVGLETAERIGMPRQVASFTLPLGAQLNKDGTSVMLGSVLLFTAQAAGVSFDAASLLSVVLVGLLLSEGSGGIPGGGFVVALIYVQAFQLPVEVAAIVGGIYRLVDVGNTTINVMGDFVATALVEHSESNRERR